MKTIVGKFESGFTALDQANDEEKIAQMDEEDAENEEVQQQLPAPELVKETPSSTATDESVNNTNDEKRKANAAPTALA